MLKPSNGNVALFTLYLSIGYLVVSCTGFYVLDSLITARIKREATNCSASQFKCNSGECISNSKFCDGVADCTDSSDETATCQQLGDGCVLPPQPANGKYEGVPRNLTLYPGQIVSDGTVLVFTCSNNYALPTMKPRDSLFCLNKQWTKQFPTCLRTCLPRVADSVDIRCEYDNRNIDCSLPMLEGTRVTMKCKHNYESRDLIAPSPNAVSVCSGGSWDYNIIKCVPGCGKIANEEEIGIVKGSSSKLAPFPWHVGVYMKQKDTSKYEQICAGSLIAMNIVLSVAHCFTDASDGALYDLNQYVIAGGKYYRSLDDERDKTTIQQSKIKQVNVTTDYKGVQTNYQHDIAVVVLETPFKVTHIVQPVCVDWAHQYDDQQLKAGSYGEVVGWAIKKSQGNPSEELKHLRAPFIENERCYAELPVSFYPYFTSDKFCVGYTNGSSQCKGDTGSGLVFLRNENTRYYIRGVLSIAPRTTGSGCDQQKYILFTKVSVFMTMISQIEAANRISRN